MPEDKKIDAPNPKAEVRLSAHFVQDDDGTWVAYCRVGDGDNLRVAKHIVGKRRSSVENAAKVWAEEFRATPTADDDQTAIEL